MAAAICCACGVEFQVKPYRLARNTTGFIFCSAQCRTADGRTLGRPRAELDLVCPVCGASFHRKPAERRAVNYCSYGCAARATGNLKPAPKGQRRSPSTEFGARPPVNKLPVGSVTVRHRADRDDVRSWVKVAEPDVWRPLAVVVWEAANGPMPSGCVIHHVDGDSLNDRIDNLECLTRAQHAAVHHSS